MNLRSLFGPAVAAVLVGIVQWYFLLLCYMYIAMYNPIPAWLARSGVGGIAFHLTLFPMDFLIHCALSLPAAFVLLKLRPSKLWLYLIVAVIPGFIWFDHPLADTGFAWWIVQGWIPNLLAIPFAAWVLRVIFKPGAPDNSSRRTRVPRAA